MVVEQRGSLENVLTEGQASEESDEVSEEAADELKEAEVAESKEGEKGKKVEPTKPETPDAFESRLQAEIDKRTNAYREKREADTAYIKSLAAQVKELKAGSNDRKLSKAMELILEGDAEEGLEPDKIEGRRKALDEIKGYIKTYNEQSAEVALAAQFVNTMAEKLPKKIVEEFGLNDANPNLRAVNGVKFLEDSIALFKQNQDFLLAIKHFLPKGDELREKLDDIVKGLAEFGDEKSKLLYIKDRLQGVRIARKKLPAPSDGSGGEDLSKLDGGDLIERWLTRQNRK